jgi:hypothetical protein
MRYLDSPLVKISGAGTMRFTGVLLLGNWLVTSAGLGMIAGVPAAFAANYEFLAAPETDLNRVYRLDKASGEIGACQYGLKEASIGVTLCYHPGEGAGPQAPGEYSLIASRHEREGGVFRIDMRTGNMSVCYVLNEAVVCTPPAR